MAKNKTIVYVVGGVLSLIVFLIIHFNDNLAALLIQCRNYLIL